MTHGDGRNERDSWGEKKKMWQKFLYISPFSLGGRTEGGREGRYDYGRTARRRPGVCGKSSQKQRPDHLRSADDLVPPK